MKNNGSGLKASMWIAGVVSQLDEMDLIESNFQMTSKGIAEWDQLHASGYRPSDKQIDDCCDAFGCELEIAKLLKLFRDRGREWFEGNKQ